MELELKFYGIEFEEIELHNSIPNHLFCKNNVVINMKMNLKKLCIHTHCNV